ncbi:50S ribosomal protein L11 methyltransferase [Candidatus Woesearchaeota archaeon]|nr:50S ribosomal protein L11 methyltransferase [Candidatus Woesearchaeota archaeon]
MTSTPAQRVKEVLNSCRIINDDTVKTFASFCENFGYVFKGKPVIDIGCGSGGGLCKFVLEQGATKYTGVDIDSIAIRSSRHLEPRGVFIFDDPIHVLSTLKESHVVISAAVFDVCIIDDRTVYPERLVQAIAQQTPEGWYTVHWGGNLYKFTKYFEDSNFQKVHILPEKMPCFGVYQKSARRTL